MGPKGYLQGLLGYRGLNNSIAPTSSADAAAWGVGARTTLRPVQIEAWYWKYFVESDASVAVYNDSWLGNNNRTGEAALLKIDFMQLKFALVGEWYNSRTINSSSNQHTLNVIYIGVETHYADF